jgi:hypothetical protein
MVKWETEFNQMMNDQRNMDFDYDTMGIGQWEDPSSSFRTVAFDHDGIPLLGDYEFGSSLSLYLFTAHGPEIRR